MKKLLLFIPMILFAFSGSAQTYDNPGGTIKTCSGRFRDTGGLDTTYKKNENIVTTFCAPPDTCIQVSFWEYQLAKGDTLRVYDGSDVSSRVIGTYIAGSNPGIIKSSKGCLTFKFTSDTAAQGSGWDANITCTKICSPVGIAPGGTHNICSGKFFDSGGINEYKNNENSVTTLCSSTPGSCIRVSFLDFNLGNGDTMRIYDGADVSARLIGKYVNDPGPIVSSKGCLTFKFTSDTADTGNGWDGNITCTSTCAPNIVVPGGTHYACSGKFYDSGGRDSNYGNNEHTVTTLCADSVGKKIEVTSSDFSIKDEDLLIVYDGNSTSATVIGAYNSANEPPYKTTSTNQCLTFEFTSDTAGTALGWDFTIKCIAPVSVPELSALSHSFILQSNPAISQLIGQLYSAENTAFTVDIMDLQGRLVSSKKLNALKGSNSFIVDLDAMEKGLYIIRISTGAYSVQKKFVKL